MQCMTKVKEAGDRAFDELIAAVRDCRICRDAPRYGEPLPQEPRPILQARASARICIASQAPGIRAHTSGVPFDDPSGLRLREWLGMTDAQFYDADRVAIVPMGFCFPGFSAAGGDLPPRRECAEEWHERIFAALTQLRILVVIGGYAHRWHLGAAVARQSVSEIVASWRDLHARNETLRVFALPHPSWHNNLWIKRNPWFSTELLPFMQESIREALNDQSQ